MARVLGLDLGSHSVKAVIVEAAYRGGAAVKGEIGVGRTAARG